VLLAAGAPLSDVQLAARAEETFQRGLAQRQRGEKSRALFQASARDFEELRRRGVRNALLERDLGNAYQLAGDLPRAILAYRRGLRLLPGDRALRRNLQEARGRVIHLEGSGFGRPPETMRPPWLPNAPRTLFALAVVGYVVGCIALTRWYMIRRGRWVVLGVTGLIVVAGATLLLVVSLRLESSRPVVVIAADGVLLRKGNSRAFPPRFDTPLSRGVEASLLYRRDGWLQIELSGGEVGWVSEKEAVVEESEGEQP
jgi:hypothetical protein